MMVEREIGGYIEFEYYHGKMFHDNAIALNCGRNALAYLLKARNIDRLWIPKFICDSVTGVCEREGISYSFYSIGLDFLPVSDVKLGEADWLYLVNYYSQLDNETIAGYVEKYKRVIVDNVQSYYQPPLPNVDTIYSCRKYFGVPNGAFLYTDVRLEDELPTDESFEQMHYLMGRFEKSAFEYYGEYVANEEQFASEPIKQMSKLTRNLLCALDYEHIKEVRENNYRFLHKELGCINELKLKDDLGTFMYPFMIENGDYIRERLQDKKIYIPTLWQDVFGWCKKSEIEYLMAENILPIPIDQRYGIETMKYLADTIYEVKNNDSGIR